MFVDASDCALLRPQRSTNSNVVKNLARAQRETKQNLQSCKQLGMQASLSSIQCTSWQAVLAQLSYLWSTQPQNTAHQFGDVALTRLIDNVLIGDLRIVNGSLRPTTTE